MSVFVRSGRTVRSISTIVLTATLPTSAVADSSAGELIGTWGQVLDFPPALKGELTVKRNGKNCIHSFGSAATYCADARACRADARDSHLAPARGR